MNLTILERLMAVNLFAMEGDLAFLQAKRDLVKKVGLTIEELKEYDVKPGEEQGTVIWNQDLPQEKEIPLSGAEKAFILAELKKKLDEKKLHENELSLYEKLVE